jgi:hypothetical protein
MATGFGGRLSFYAAIDAVFPDRLIACLVATAEMAADCKALEE